GLVIGDLLREAVGQNLFGRLPIGVVGGFYRAGGRVGRFGDHTRVFVISDGFGALAVEGEHRAAHQVEGLCGNVAVGVFVFDHTAQFVVGQADFLVVEFGAFSFAGQMLANEGTGRFAVGVFDRGHI